MERPEALWLCAFLEDLSNRYDDDTRNDTELSLPDTPENRKLVEDANKYNYEDPPALEIAKKKIVIEKIMLLDYLRHKLGEENKIDEEELPTI